MGELDIVKALINVSAAAAVVATVILFLRYLSESRKLQADELRESRKLQAEERREYMQVIREVSTDHSVAMELLGNEVASAGEAHRKASEIVCSSLNSIEKVITKCGNGAVPKRSRKPIQ